MYYDDFENLISLKGDKYDLEAFQVGHFFIDKVNFIGVHFESEVLSALKIQRLTMK